MTNRMLAVGGVILVLLAVAVNTYFVFELVENGRSHHSDTSSKIGNLERELRHLQGGINDSR